MKRQALVSVFMFCAVATMAVSARAQSVAPAPSPTDALRVRFTCDACDLDFVKNNVGFVEFVVDSTAADVEVVALGDEKTDRPWRLAFVGLGRFAGQDRMLSLSTASLATTIQIRRELVRVLKVGLVEYAAETAAGPQLDVTVRDLWASPSPVIVNIDGPELDVTVRGLPVPAAPPAEDRWNYWVFQINADSDGSGEQSSFDTTYNVSASANRTTAGSKVRIGVSRSLNRSSFRVSDDLTIKARLSDWRADALIVKSLGSHFSLGVVSSVAGSTFSNEKFVARVSPGIEYDIFPYGESTRRSLTIQYTAGQAYYDYEAETVFGKLTERVAQQAINVSLGLRQPWGHAGSTFVFTQQIREPDRTRTTLLANLSVRLTRHFSVNGSGTYSRIRDQFTLEKGEATEEEVLLRQRQLATGHRYSVSVGFSFSFGSLSNATVNPRFTR
ncbi:MAG: hypothetical protein ACRDFA_04215 [bacterium]